MTWVSSSRTSSGRTGALFARAGIPPDLSAFEVVDPEEFPTLPDNAMKDAGGATNPRQPTRDEFIALDRAAYGPAAAAAAPQGPGARAKPRAEAASQRLQAGGAATVVAAVPLSHSRQRMMIGIIDPGEALS
jgi:hypothetical protein